MTDLTYLNTGLFTRFIPNTPAGEDAWRCMVNQEGSASVLSIHAANVIGQLRKAGYSVGKGKPVKMSDDELLTELGV
jgi:hypothetical protein